MMAEEVATTARADLIGGIERGLVAALAHVHMAHDVLDFDDGIVHQHTGHQRQGQQADLVEREAHDIHEGEGRNGRQRNARAEIAVARISRRNSHTTATASNEPSINASSAVR